MLGAQSPTCTFCGANFTKSKAKFCGKCGKPRSSISYSNNKENVQSTHESHSGLTSSTQQTNAAERQTSPSTTATISPAAAATALLETRKISTSPNEKSSNMQKQEHQDKVAHVVETTSSSSQAGLIQEINEKSDSNDNVIDESNPFSTIKDSAALQIITPLMLETTNADELRSWRRGNLIGKGSFGSVYLGLLPSTGTFCAVKCVELASANGYGNVYSDHSETSMRELVLLSREINLLRQLSHPNLCSFYGVYYDAMNSSINIFMEYISGGALTSIIKKFMPLPAQLIRSWTIQLLKGLAYLHSQKIIHRDIKGDNILIDITAPSSSNSAAAVSSMDSNTNKTSVPDNQVKLVDFGAARKLSDKFSQSRTVIGTPYWMAPEVVLSGANADEPCEEPKHNGDEQESDKKEKNASDNGCSSGGYSYKADVWSVGCTVAEMHTGKPPWPVCANATAAILMIARCGSTQPLFEPKRPSQAHEEPVKNAEKQEEEELQCESSSESEEEEEEELEEMDVQQQTEREKEMSTKVASQRASISSNNNNKNKSTNVKLDGNNTKGLFLTKEQLKKLQNKSEINSTSSNTTDKSNNHHVNKTNTNHNKTNKPKRKISNVNKKEKKKVNSAELGKLGSDGCSTNSGGLSSSSNNNTTSTYNSNKSNNSSSSNNASVHPANRLELPLHLATPGCASFMQQCCTINPSLRPSVYELLQHP